MDVTTDRLVGRPPEPGDLDLYRELLNDPDVALTMGGRRTDDDLRAALIRHLDGWQLHGFGPWLLHDRATGDFVGRGGLNRVTPIDREEIEVGYALLPTFWGQGRATELARASIRLGFDRGFGSIVGFTLPSNAASRRVLEKCGMLLEREFVHCALPHVFLRVWPHTFVDASGVG